MGFGGEEEEVEGEVSAAWGEGVLGVSAAWPHGGEGGMGQEKLRLEIVLSGGVEILNRSYVLL